MWGKRASSHGACALLPGRKTFPKTSNRLLLSSNGSEARGWVYSYNQWLDQNLGPFLGTRASLASIKQNSGPMNKERGTIAFEEVSCGDWQEGYSFIQTHTYANTYYSLCIYMHITYTKVK